MTYKLVENTIGISEKKALKKLISEEKQLTYSSNVKKLENKIAKIHKRKYCIMVNSGSSANLLGISSAIYSKNIKINKNDEVIVPTLSWSTTYAPLIQYGLKLRFVDIKISTLNIDEDLIEKAITKKTKAIFCVNILGKCCNYDKIIKIAKRNNLYLFEDNCESFGSIHKNRISGTFGLFSSLSSYFSHHINTIEGGYLLTDNFELYCNALSIRSHGWIREQPKNSHLLKSKINNHIKQFRFFLPGYNLRPTEISATIGLIQLKRIDKFLKNRRYNAKFFYNLFKNENFVSQEYNKDDSFFGFTIIIKNKLYPNLLEIIKQINKKKIETRPIISGNILKNKMLKYAKYSVYKNPRNAEFIEKFGFMIGNRSTILNKNEKEKLMELSNILNSYS